MNLEISSEASIRETLELINRTALGSALIIDDKKKLVGIVTDGDIRRALLKDLPLTTSIKVVMNPNPTLIEDTNSLTISEIYNLMLEKHIMVLPIIDRKRRIKDIIKFIELCKLKEKINPTKNSNKVLVIGGAGYIGSVLVNKLLKKGYKVTVFDNLLYNINPLQKFKNIKFIKGDIRNTDSLLRAMRGVDSVIHLAAVVGDDVCRISSDFTIEINYVATKRIAQLAKFLNIKKFIFASTCSIYGKGEGEFYETSPVYPLSLYAKTKLFAEEAILSLADNSFFPIILRLSTVYGSSLRPRFDLVINLLTAKALTENKITIHGGQQWRPFIHIADVADAMIAFLKKNIPSYILNVGEGNYQLYEIGMLIKEVVKEETNLKISVDIDDKSYDQRDYMVNFNRLKSTNFSCKKNIRYGIIELINELKKTPYWSDKRYNNYKELSNIK